jgi:hypothetical protein
MQDQNASASSPPRVELTLPPGAIRALAMRIGRERLTRLSPLHTDVEGVEPPPSWSGGIVGADGGLAPGVIPTLEVLAAPRSYAQLQILRGEALIRHAVYFGAPGRPGGVDGSARVGTVLGQDGVRVVDPAPVFETLALLRDHLGTSLSRTVELDVELPRAEGLALAAMIDAQRVANLRALVEGREPTIIALSPEALANAIAACPATLLSVLPTLTDALDEAVVLDARSLAAPLEALVRRGLLTLDAGAYAPSDTILALAGTMTLFGAAVTLAAVEELPRGAIVGVAFVLLVSGPTDVLMLSAHDDVVALTSIAPGAAIDLVAHLYCEPRPLDALPSVRALDAPIPPTQVAMKRVVPCRTCSTPLPPDARFCARCGTPVVEPAASFPGTGHCPRCHKALPGGAAFCIHCGYRMG